MSGSVTLHSDSEAFAALREAFLNADTEQVSILVSFLGNVKVSVNASTWTRPLHGAHPASDPYACLTIQH